MYRTYKNLVLIFTFILLLGNSGFVFAQNCNTATWDDYGPQLYQIVCPIARVINVFLLVIGVVVVVMIVVGALKMALSFGDPKGFKGALTTWQYVALGGLIVVGVFAILYIVLGLFGVDLNPMSLTDFIADFIYEFSDSIGIQGTP